MSTTALSSTSLPLKSCQEWTYWAQSGWVSSSHCSSSSTRTSSSHSHMYHNTSKTPINLGKTLTCVVTHTFYITLHCIFFFYYYLTHCVFECLHQVAQRHSVPLGLNADWLHQHPHVLSGVALDARCLPTFLPACPSAGQSGTARRERTALHDVSKVKTRTKTKKWCFERHPDRKHQLPLNRLFGGFVTVVFKYRPK